MSAPPAGARLPATMRQARIHGPGDLRIDTVPLPLPAEDEVVVKVLQAAIAGTDLKFFAGELVPEVYPQGVGGAGVGEVVARGAAVTRFELGQRVLALGPAGCGHCARCRQGLGGFCINRTVPMRRRGACFAEYVVLPAFQCEPVDDRLSDDQVVAQPTISLAIHVRDLFGYPQAAPVVVVGAGKVGTGQIVYHVSRGARVCAVELRADRRALSLELGAELAVDPRAPDAREQVHAWANPIAEYMVDAACTVASQRFIFDTVAPGGHIALLGTAPWEVPVQWIVHRSLRVFGCRAGAQLHAASTVLLEGSIDLSRLITHRVTLEDLPAAYRWLASEPAGALIVIIHPHRSSAR